jgi:hypothetical protein
MTTLILGKVKQIISREGGIDIEPIGSKGQLLQLQLRSLNH